jgi:tetratricopeptide (TPR) repeat protein
MNETQFDIFFVKGIEAVQNRELFKAKDFFEKAIANKENQAASWAFHGDIQLKLKKTQDALDSYQNGLTLFPDNVNLLFRCGLLLKKMKNYPDAITLLDKAVSLAPHNFTLWMTRGDTYFQIRDYNESLASYEKAITIHSWNPAPWEKKGWTLRRLGRFDEA